ncbi:hypothetical protein D3C72_1316350 [compost metagenome]
MVVAGGVAMGIGCGADSGAAMFVASAHPIGARDRMGGFAGKRGVRARGGIERQRGVAGWWGGGRRDGGLRHVALGLDALGAGFRLHGWPGAPRLAAKPERSTPPQH